MGTKQKKSSCSLPELHVRLLDDDHEELKNIANSQGISKAEAARRIIHAAIAADAAENGLDVITSALRKTIRAELDGRFKELKDIEHKTLSTAATAQFLLLRSLRHTMKGLSESEFKEIYETARRDAFNHVYRCKAANIDFSLMDTDTGEGPPTPGQDTDYASLLSGGRR